MSNCRPTIAPPCISITLKGTITLIFSINTQALSTSHLLFASGFDYFALFFFFLILTLAYTYDFRERGK